MAMKAIAIGNLLMIQYFLTSHYRVPHKWVWLVVSALVLSTLLVRKGAAPK